MVGHYETSDIYHSYVPEGYIAARIYWRKMRFGRYKFTVLQDLRNRYTEVLAHMSALFDFSLSGR